MKKSLSIAWIVTVLALGILSYTQVDLNLTLLNWQPYLNLQQQFTQLGYFNRSLNGLLFSLIFIALGIGYLALVKAAHAKWITLSELMKLATITGVILLFSYSVFSHDIFNYIFDARIVTQYQQNPYEHKALDYPNDDWIRFMQWTHRNYPYGPSWLLITIIPSVLGFAKLLPTYLLFKALFVVSYLFLLKYTEKIIKIRKMSTESGAVIYALIAFNPVIIVDGLVSSRIDLVMAALAIIAIYYHMKAATDPVQRVKHDRLSYIWLLLSGGTKFATLGFLPVFFADYHKMKEEKWFAALFAFAAITVPMQIYLRGLQPWYFILPLTLLPFMYPYWRLRTILIITFLMLLPMTTYIHFIYTGISKDALWFLFP